MKKITKLTDEQTEMMHKFTKEWIEKQLDTISTPETEKEAEENYMTGYMAVAKDIYRAVEREVYSRAVAGRDYIRLDSAANLGGYFQPTKDSMESNKLNESEKK